MSQNHTPTPQTGHAGRDPGDALLRRYHEANALDPARPSPALREAVLAQARAAAAGQATTKIAVLEAPQAANHGDIDPEVIADYDHPTLGTAQKRQKNAVSTPKTARSAANDTSWRIRAAASVAVLGLATLLFLQFDRGAPEERDLALGGPAATTAPGTDAQAPGLKGESGSAGTPAPAMAKAPTDASGPLPQRAPGNAGPPPAPPAGAPALAQDAAQDHPRPAAAPAPAPMPRDKPTTAASVDPKVTPAGTARHENAASEPAHGGPVAESAARVGAAGPGLTAEALKAAPLPEVARAPVAAPAHSPPPAAPMAAPATAQAERPAKQALEARPRTPPSAVGRSAAADETGPPGGAAAASQRLLVAARTGALEAARQALKDGAPVNAADASGQTALMLAARRGDEAMVTLLLAAGADRTRTDSAGLSAAQHAGRAGHAALLPVLTPPESAQQPTRPGPPTQPDPTRPNPGTFPSSEKN